MAVTGILLLVFGVNYLKGLDLLQRRNVYHAIYTDITGIAETTPLLLNGFKVGSVVNTQLLPGAGARIMVSYQVNEDGLTLPEDSRVVLTGDLLNKWAELRLGRSAELAQAGDTITGDVKPGIAQTLSDQIDPLKQKAEAILINIDSVLTAFQDVLNPGTRGDINASFRLDNDLLYSSTNECICGDNDNRNCCHAVPSFFKCSVLVTSRQSCEHMV